MAPPLTDDEKKKIIGYLKEGKSQNWVAKEVGRSADTVCRLAKAEGIQSDIRAPKNANEARRDYALVERISLLNELFDHARAMLPKIKDAKELQALTIAIATAIDKRRLEDGEATNRSETVDTERRQKMRESLDEVAQRRRERLAG